ncbi:MAG: hypothetical protein U0031_11160 [Thermomicrobiales bacterium]
MNEDRLDAIARALGAAETRRGLLRLGAALPLAGGLATLLGESGEAGLYHRRRARHRRGDQKENRKGKRNGNGKGKVGSGACIAAADDLQGAIDAAAAGSTLTLCDGIFQVNIRIDKNLTLAGASTASTILNDAGAQSAIIGIGQNARVTIQDLTVATSSGNGWWGINNSGKLQLLHVTVTGGARPLYGGGIINSGSLTVGDGTTVFKNGADYEGGGIYNDEGNVTLQKGSTVTDNVAVFGGGIYNYFGILLVESGANITSNMAGGSDDGGGIYNEGGTVTIIAGANVSGNDPNNCGGDPVNGTCS